MAIAKVIRRIAKPVVEQVKRDPRPVRAEVNEKDTIFSTRDHATKISYNGEETMLPPRGKLSVDSTKLGILPKGVILIRGN